jgi:hypothetical protein
MAESISGADIEQAIRTYIQACNDGDADRIAHALLQTRSIIFRMRRNGLARRRLATVSRRECRRSGKGGRWIKFLSTQIDARERWNERDSTKRGEWSVA